jgi:hypothetical protein
MPDAQAVEEVAVPGTGEEDWRDRPAWGDRTSTPAAQLAVLANRMNGIEDQLKVLRREAKEARAELRDEVRGRLDDIVAAKADAYRIAQVEINVATMATDIKAALSAKANTWVVNLLAVLVFGFIGIILTAVAYNILEARPTITEHAATADHSGSNPK